jgi:hypothetical protein
MPFLRDERRLVGVSALELLADLFDGLAHLAIGRTRRLVKLARGFVGRAFFLQLDIAGHVADARLTFPLTCSPLPLI